MAKTAEKIAILLLRYGVAFLFLMWGIDKIVASDKSVGIFNFFYGIPITENIALYIGMVEILFALVLAAGLWRTITYGAAVLLHGISTLSTYRQLLDPFGENHLFIAGVPVLLAAIALYLLRKKDTMWTLG